MKKNNPALKCSKSDAVCESPVRSVGCKHHATPMKTRSKTSKSENDEGNYQQLKSLTISDFLKNMQYSSEQNGDNPQPLSHVQLLEKWNMFHTKSPGAPKVPFKYHSKMPRKPSHKLLKEMKEILKTLKETDDKVSNSNTVECEEVSAAGSYRMSSPEISKCVGRESDSSPIRDLKHKISFGEKSCDPDSDTELWGNDCENDDHLVVKATQDFEACLISSGLCSPLTCVVPETCQQTRSSTEDSRRTVQNSCDQNLKNCTQIIDKNSRGLCTSSATCKESDVNVLDMSEWDWDSDCEDGNWDDDLTVIDALSQVPDDVLQGRINSDTCTEHVVNETVKLSPTTVGDKDTSVSTIMDKNNGCSSKVNSSECVIHHVRNHDWHDIKSDAQEIEDQDSSNSTHILLDMDSDVFDDVSFFNDASETIVLSESRPQCTAVEIAKKKEEALRKLKLRQGNLK